MQESARANRRRASSHLWQRVLSGRGIDIGCGDDPVNKEGKFPDILLLETFDIKDGDASYMTRYKEQEVYDFVYSSHCLEHLPSPLQAIREWWALVKVGGYLAFQVPDEDLYEQGVFPSRWNPDHKKTFTLFKSFDQRDKSWSVHSINVIDMVRGLPGAKPWLLQLCDHNYDHKLINVDQTFIPLPGGAEVNIEVVLQKTRSFTIPRSV